MEVVGRVGEGGTCHTATKMIFQHCVTKRYCADNVTMSPLTVG